MPTDHAHYGTALLLLDPGVDRYDVPGTPWSVDRCTSPWCRDDAHPAQQTLGVLSSVTLSTQG